MRTLIFIILATLSQLGFSQTSLKGVVNVYSKVSDIRSVQCNSRIEIGNTSDYLVGDRILIIQMKGAVIDSSNSQQFGDVISISNAGNFEFCTIIDIEGAAIITNELSNDYSPKKGAVQIVSVPEYTSASVDETLRCAPWNGQTGGVLVLEVKEQLILNADIDVSGLGFRGGSISNNPDGSCGSGSLKYFYPLTQGGGSWAEGGAEKGEGVVTVLDNKMAGKGKLANGGGGGNKHNHGGGGGGNCSKGGKGGNALAGCSNFENGGVGGLNLVPSNLKIFLGGGGGCGDDNNRVGTKGENGGGIVLIKAKTLNGANHSVLSNGNSQKNNGFGIADGAGGGGAGGSIFLDLETALGVTNLHVNGGDGGDQEAYYGCVGPGGGGGSGAILMTRAHSSSAFTVSQTPGEAGEFLTSGFPCSGTSYGAQGGELTTGAISVVGSWISDNESLVGYTGPDTVYLCDGGNAILAVEPTASNIVWSDGSTSDSLVISTRGAYWCNYELGKCVLVDTFIVLDINNKNNSLDTTICADDFIEYKVNSPYDSIRWSDESTDIIKEVPPATNLILYTYLKTCTMENNISVQAHTKPNISLTGDTLLCDSRTGVLRVKTDGSMFFWDNLTTDTLREIFSKGWYSITYGDDNCNYSDSIYVRENNSPELPNIPDSSICLGDEILLNVFQDKSNFSWSTGETSATKIITEPGNYYVEITNECGTISEGMSYIDGAFCDCLLFVPTSFSPNNDRLNEKFRVISNCTFRNYHLTIYNRWGQMVFESMDENKVWEGTYKERDVESGLYLVVFSTLQRNNLRNVYKGFVIVVR
jgi:gliding motility-associated-like protein